MSGNDILQPHERLILGIDTARASDACCEVTAIYDTFTGKLRIIDVQEELTRLRAQVNAQAPV